MAVESPPILIDKLLPEHWPHVARIYADGISTGNATFETAVPRWEQWDRSHLGRKRLGKLHGIWRGVLPLERRRDTVG